MRPARGRPAGAPPKRACVVRLEKVQQTQQPSRQEEATEDDRKKMTGPLKKRPVVMKKSPASTSAGRQTRRRGGGEDLSEYMLVTARAKRTPKPNPKYSNEDIITPRTRTKEAAEESEGDEDDAYQSSEVEEPQEESSEEEFEPTKPVTRGVVRLANGEVVKRGPGRPPKNRPEISTPKPSQKRRLETEPGSKELESILAQNKRLNIELYDASDSDISIVAPTPRRMARNSTSVQSQRPISRLALKTHQSQKEQPKRFLDRRRVQPQSQQRRRVSSEEDEDDPDEYETTGAASTVDDFETMPTFTIVNINDIINKKGDVMIEQTNRVNNNVSASNNNNQSASGRNEETRISPTQASRNRRKSMHTTILSDKIDPDKLKNPPPRSPFPPRKPISPHNTLNHGLSKSLLNNNQSFGSAPRILNNVLCRRTKALQAKQEQLQEQKQQQQSHAHKTTESRSEHPIQSKENHLSNFRSATSTSGPQTLPTTAQRKLPNSKVVVQRQGNKIIKKITCFETWYVINIPNVETQAPKHHLDMSLMHLANTAKRIILPSAEWNYKVNLQKVSPTQLSKMDEVFTGEVQDANISESEKHNYMPVSVMFRRASNNQKLRMPFDRAVIFKNESYYTNIEGKNVRLVGSPQKVSSNEDIEVLLQIMDEMTLVNSLVEQVTYVL